MSNADERQVAPTGTSPESGGSFEKLIDRLHHQAALKNGLLLHYDAEAKDLRSWKWPLGVFGERIQPANFFTYRALYEFRGPCCLCAIDEDAPEKYTEAAVFQKVDGLYAGEYVAACARNRCGYLVPLDRMYMRTDLPSGKYPVRTAIPQDIPRSQNDPTGVEQLLESITEPRKKRGLTVWDKLLALDEGGLLDSEFKAFLKRCSCGLVMTKRIFESHECRRSEASQPVVIDLTLDDDS